MVYENRDEKMTTESNFYSKLKDGVKAVALTATLGLAGLVGCAAPHYNAKPESDLDRKTMQEYSAWEMGDIKEFSQNIVEDAQKGANNEYQVKIQKPVMATQELDKNISDVLKTADNMVDLAAAYDSIKIQNEAIGSLYESAGIQQLITYDAETSAAVSSLVKAEEEFNVNKKNAISEDLTKLGVELQSVSKTERDQLKALLKDVPGALDVINYNETNLLLINKKVQALAKEHTLEADLVELVKYHKASADINESLFGQKQYEDGRKVIDGLAEQTLESFASPFSKVAQDHEGTETFKQIYESNLKQTWDEAKGWNEESLHNIANDYLANNLSLLWEARTNGLIDNKELQSGVRVATKDVLDKIGESLPKTRDDMSWTEVGLSLLPTGIFYIATDADMALASNHPTIKGETEAEILAQILYAGSELEVGKENRNWVAGSNALAKKRFYTSIAGLLIDGGVVGYLANDDDSSSRGSGTSGTGPAFGTGTFTPDITNGGDQ
jgi:hypothetical protein